jgi:hypothetical protein
MSEATRTIIDYADTDNAKGLRDAFYAELQDKVMAHIEDQKIRVAQSMFNSPKDPLAMVSDEPVSAQ